MAAAQINLCSGSEMYLGLSDNVIHIVAGADILRGTYSGWTAADTTTVQNYFSAVLWPLSNRLE